MKQPFFILYALMAVIQIVICNYFHFGPYVMLSILPAIVLCIPTKFNTNASLLIAFATAMAVDFLAEGLPGINTVALLPVALARETICSMVFGEDLSKRGDDFSPAKYGWPKVTFAVVLVQIIFITIYVWADGASARPFLFNVQRWFFSLIAGTLLSLPVVDVLKKDTRK